MESFLPAILYSFRRCPYAMRARYTLALLSQSVELREVVLKNKPEALLKLGGRSTVPQLIVDGKRYPESFDIMMWAINQAPASSMSLQLWPQSKVMQTKIQTWVSYIGKVLMKTPKSGLKRKLTLKISEFEQLQRNQLHKR